MSATSRRELLKAFVQHSCTGGKKTVRERKECMGKEEEEEEEEVKDSGCKGKKARKKIGVSHDGT